jgi:hypothetical protein
MVSRSNLCRTASTCFSPKSFFANFTALCSVEGYLNKDGRTRSLLSDLFGHHCKGGKQFHHYFDHNFGHGCCRRDSGIDIQAIQEFHRFEQV